MRRSFYLSLFLLVCFLGVGGWVSAQDVSRKYALLIGLNRVLGLQPVPTLSYAVHDVEKLQLALERHGYEVEPLTDHEATRREILKRLLSLTAQIKENDVFVLFFAGHGLRNSVNNKTYWLTYNAEIPLLDGEGIRLVHLLDYVKDIRAKLKVVLLDHCFSGDLVLDVAGGGVGTRDVLDGTPSLVRGVTLPPEELREQLSGGTGTAVIAAALNAAKEVSTYEHGVFTEALLQALETTDADSNGDSQLSVGELVQYLRPKVLELAHQHNFDQRVVDTVNVTNLSEAIIASNLGTSKTERYKSVLDEWYRERERYGLSLPVKLNCIQVIDAFKNAGGRVDLLDERSRKIWREISDHIDSLGLPGLVPEGVSRDLNQQVERLLGV